jgi:ubiquinone/menaquinone biosynthesis C-methylase UbiE
MDVDHLKEDPAPDRTGIKEVAAKEDAEKQVDRLHQYRFAKEYARGKKVMDLSCGEGDGSYLLSEEADSILGVDQNREPIKDASARYSNRNVEFLRGSITNIPIRGKALFDLIVCFEELEHIEKQDEFLDEMKRLLKADGIFIVSTSTKYAYTDPMNCQGPVQVRELYLDEFKNLLSNKFRHIYLYGQKVCPCSNIFPVRKEAESSIAFVVEKRDEEFCIPPQEKKSARHFIAVASDNPLVESLIRRDFFFLHSSQALFKQKDDQISDLQEMLRSQEAALSEKTARLINLERVLRSIYNSPSWKAVWKLRGFWKKSFPGNTKRRLVANVILRSLLEPGKVFKRLNKTNVRKFFHYFWIAEPSVLEMKIEREISQPSDTRQGGGVAEKCERQQEEVFECTPSAAGPGLIRAEEHDGRQGESVKANPPRVIAFYLPQFHPIPENDRWWGKGFTDWANVVKAKPNFAGHYQPHLPADLGFYDLRVAEVREQQADLARKNGIYGFCYHHYWFHGHRLLERPFNEVLKSGRPGFPFCLCWANENWTRRWDGAEQEILIAQSHSKEDDIAFIRDLMPAFRDDRYIRINGRPLLIVYRVNILPRPEATAEIWREECKASGVGEIYLCAAQTFDIMNPGPYGFDAAVEFPPHGLFILEISGKVQVTNPDFTGLIHDYEDVVRFMKRKKCPRYTLFRTVMPSWDNTARRQNASSIFVNATPELYQEWLTHGVEYADKNLVGEERLIFINAWNEWGEGCHLEPGKKYGNQLLKATREILIGRKIMK